MQRRTGYRRLMDGIRAGEIGAVFASELSRIGRNGRDLLELLDACRQRDVLLVVDGRVHDCRDPGTRFFQQLDSIIGEYENVRRRQTFERARIATARNGKAVSRPPRGYVRGHSKGAWEKDSDLLVQQSLLAVWRTFLEQRSQPRTLRALLTARVKLPRRHADGHLTWVQPTIPLIGAILRNPTYTGDLVYRRHRIDQSKDPYPAGSPRYRKATPEEIIVVKSHHAPYITHAEFEEVQHILKTNGWSPKQQNLGPGPALLQGILRCGIHSYRMQVVYQHRNKNGEVYYLYS